MTKTETWNKVSTDVLELLAGSKVPKKLQEELMTVLESHLAPKVASGGKHPPKEIDGVMHYYCRWHQAYEPEHDMVLSNRKSKGYCKAAISKWNKMQRDAKSLDQQALDAMADNDFDKAQELALEAKELKHKSNSPASYDLVADWADFTGSTKE